MASRSRRPEFHFPKVGNPSHYICHFWRFHACFSAFWNPTGKASKTDPIRPFPSAIGLDPPISTDQSDQIFYLTRKKCTSTTALPTLLLLGQGPIWFAKIPLGFVNTQPIVIKLHTLSDLTFFITILLRYYQLRMFCYWIVKFESSTVIGQYLLCLTHYHSIRNERAPF